MSNELRELFVGRREQSVLPVTDELRHAGRAHRHDRDAGAARLERGQAERFADGRKNEHVAIGEVPANLLARLAAFDRDVISETVARDGTLQCDALRAIADDAQVNVAVAEGARSGAT